MPEEILITPRSITREGHPFLSWLSDAGYELSFAPGFNPTVVEAAIAANFPFFPGVATPSIIERAASDVSQCFRIIIPRVSRCIVVRPGRKQEPQSGR